MNKKSYLYLIWKNPVNKRNYEVGKLTRADGYKFEYWNEYEQALADGWKLIQAFPEVKEYYSKELFPVFSSRLPDKKRRDIETVLKKYGLEEYDGYELLRKSGGRLPIDTYEFIDPIFPEDITVQREFYVVGIRHKSGCEGKTCITKNELVLNMDLILSLEPENQYDSNAVLVETPKGTPLGYVPRYYSESVAFRIKKHMTYECSVIEINEEMDCQNCAKVKLVMPRE